MEELYEIGVSPDGTYIYARKFRQPYTPKLALKVASELRHFGEKLDVVGCLVDIRGTTHVSSISDQYKFAYEKSKDVGLRYDWKYAFLMDHNHDSSSFIETVMINAGYEFQIFTDERKAVDWLKAERSN